jgi:hypothetical protein
MLHLLFGDGAVGPCQEGLFLDVPVQEPDLIVENRATTSS